MTVVVIVRNDFNILPVGSDLSYLLICTANEPKIYVNGEKESNSTKQKQPKQRNQSNMCNVYIHLSRELSFQSPSIL